MFFDFKRKLQNFHFNFHGSIPMIADFFSPTDPPGIPGTPECEGTTEDSISLSWTPPKKDGGNPIKGYVVEKREKGTDNWSK